MAKSVDCLDLEDQMLKTSERLEDLATRVDKISDKIVYGGGNVKVNLKNPNNGYHQLRNEILGVKSLQKQLDNSIQLQMQLLQSKCTALKEKYGSNEPENLSGVSNASTATTTSRPSTVGKTPQDDKTKN